VLDYLIALLRNILGSFLALFGRIQAARFLQEWLGDSVHRLGPLAGFFAISIVALLGTLAVVAFFWVLKRHPGHGKRARILAEVLPFETPGGTSPDRTRREDGHAG
jgi:hypothetical protein